MPSLVAAPSSGLLPLLLLLTGIDAAPPATPVPNPPTPFRITTGHTTAPNTQSIRVFTGQVTDPDANLPVAPAVGGTCTCVGNGCTNNPCTCQGGTGANLITTANIMLSAANNADATLEVQTSPQSNTLTSRQFVLLQCRVTDAAGENSNFFRVEVEVVPNRNQAPQITLPNGGDFTRFEDNSPTPTTGPAGGSCINIGNVFRVRAGPFWEYNAGYNGQDQVDTANPGNKDVCEVLPASRCESSTGSCFTPGAGQPTLTLTGGGGDRVANLAFCLTPDAVGVIQLRCTFTDTGRMCCQGGVPVELCPANLVMWCNNQAPLTSQQTITLNIEEVNDVPIAALPAVNIPNNRHIWQEDCGLSGYSLDCLSAGAARPTLSWTDPLVTTALQCSGYGTGAQITRNGVRMWPRCTPGGALNALPNMQGITSATSESNAGIGGNQRTRVLCNTNRNDLFMNGAAGCPGCGGAANCGCPTLGPAPQYNQLDWMPARHAVGRASVTCYMEDIQPNPPGANVASTSMGGTSALEGGVQRRELTTFEIHVAEVNDPPSADLNPATVTVPTPLQTAPNAVDRLPRVIFRKDPSWVGPTYKKWTGPSPVDPDPGACTVVDCCIDDNLGGVVTVTGVETTPHTLPGATGTIAIKDCPVTKRSKCCAIDNFWFAGDPGCGTRTTAATCNALSPGCQFVGGVCVPRGYADPAATPFPNGAVGLWPGPTSEQGVYNQASFMWDQQWNIKCRAVCEPNGVPTSFYGPGICDETVFEAAVMPHSLSDHCYDPATHAPCTPAQLWQTNKPKPHQLVFRASAKTGPRNSYKRGSIRLQCSMVDESQPDGSVECNTLTQDGNYNTYISGCKDSTTFDGTGNNCPSTGAPPLGFPCPSNEVPADLDRLPDPIEFILEFTAPNFTLSDFPTPQFDGVKGPYWEVQVNEDSNPVDIRNFAQEPNTWAHGAEIGEFKGTVTCIPYDSKLFSGTALPKIANLLPRQKGGDLIFTPETDMSGHTWVVVGIADDGGTAGIPNGPAYEEFILWIKEVNDAPIATVNTKIAPSSKLTVTEDTNTRVGTGFTFPDFIPDLAPGPKREVDPMPGKDPKCPLQNDFPGCGVIPITLPDPIFTTYTGRQCSETCGTGDGCGCGQELTVTCTAARSEFFAEQPMISPVGCPMCTNPTAGQLTFRLKDNAAGTTEVTCSVKDCKDVIGQPACTTTTDGEPAKTTVVKFTIDITDINDPPLVSLVPMGLPIRVKEDSPTTTVGVLTGILPGPQSEVDAGQTVQISCQATNPMLFEGQPIVTLVGSAMTFSSAQITFTPKKDAAGTSTIDCQVADDGSPRKTTKAPPFEIIIEEVNDEPTGDLIKTNIEVKEDSGAHSVKMVNNLIPGPPSEQITQKLTIDCVPSDTSLMVNPVMSTSGVFTFTTAKDAVGITTVECTFTDDGTPNLSMRKSFTVTITEVNDPPVVVVNGVNGSPTITVQEDDGEVAQPNFLVNLAPGPPSESGQGFTFSCIATDPSLFKDQPRIERVGDSGTVRFTTAKDAAGQTNVNCRATDNGDPNLFTDFSFIIDITEINDPPIATVTQNPVIVPEDAPSTTIQGFLSPLSPGPTSELGQTMVITCMTTTTNLFAVRPTISQSGALSFTVARDRSGTAAVDCTVTDQGIPPASTDVSFNIEVTEVNDPPLAMLSNKNITVNEDSGKHTFSSHLTGIAAGPPQEVSAGQTFTYSCIHTNPSIFEAGGEPALTVTGSIGSLTFTVADDTAGATTMSCTFTDSGTPQASTIVEFTITVVDLNDAPKATCTQCPTGIIVDEDSGKQTIMDWLTMISVGPASEASQTLSIKCVPSGSTTLWFKDNTVTPPVDGSPAIDPTTGVLTFTPAKDESGMSSVACTLSDHGDPQPSRSTAIPIFTIHVKEVNDKPTAEVDPSGVASVAVGSSASRFTNWITKISPGPPQEKTQTVVIKCKANDPSLFSAQPTVDRATGDLTFTPATPTSEGRSLVTCDLTDNGIPPETLAVSFTVALENQPPTAKVAKAVVSVDEDSGDFTQTGFLTDLTPGPLVEQTNGQSIATVTCTPTVTTLFSVAPTISNTGTLQFTPAGDAAGSSRVDCTVSDNGIPQRSINVNFTVEVREINDKPVLTLNQMTVTTTENGGPAIFKEFIRIVPGPASESTQSVSAMCVSMNPSVLSSGPTINLNGWSETNRLATLELTPAVDVSGMTTVDCTITDDGNPPMSSVITFDLTVAEENDPPLATLTTANVVIPEDAPYVLDGLLTAIAPGPPAEVAAGQMYTITCSPENVLLFATTGQPAIDVNGRLTVTPAEHAVGKTKVGCDIVDDGSPPRTLRVEFTIEILEANDPPIAVVTSPTGTATVLEDSGPASFQGFVSPLSPGPASELGQILVVTCRYDNPTLFEAPPSITVAAGFMGTSNGQLSFTPKKDQVGSSKVACDVTDNGLPPKTTAINFNIRVDEVNDPPTVQYRLNRVVVLEDSGVFTDNAFVSSLQPGPTSESGQSITTTCMNTNPQLFVDQPTITPGGQLSLTPSPNQTGDATVTCTFTDNGNPPAGVDASFVVVVEDVNDPPTLTLSRTIVTAAEDTAVVEVPNFITSVAPGPGPEATQDEKVGVTCTAADPSMFKSAPLILISDDTPTVGTLRFTPAPDKVGKVKVTCQAADKKVPPAVTDFSFEVRLTEVNDPPIIIVPTSTVQAALDVTESPRVYPGFMNISAGPPSEASQVLTHSCQTTNPALFKTAPNVDPVTGDLTFTPIAGISMTYAKKSTVSCSFTDDGNPSMTKHTTFVIDLTMPESPQLIDEYRASPEFKDSPGYELLTPYGKWLQTPEGMDSPAGKDRAPLNRWGQELGPLGAYARESPAYKHESPLGKYLKDVVATPAFKDSPAYDAMSPLSQYWETSEGRNSPSYKHYIGNTGPIRKVLRVLLRMRQSAFRVSTFREILRRALNRVIVSTEVFWVCPQTACPFMACPLEAQQRLDLGCTAGPDVPLHRGMAVLQDTETIVVDFDVTTDELKPQDQVQREIESSLNTEIQKANTGQPTPVSDIQMQQVVIRECGDCLFTPPPGPDDDLEWWVWLLVALGALLCCLLLLLLYCCCCRKKKKKQKELSSESGSDHRDFGHPDAPVPGKFGADYEPSRWSDEGSRWDGVESAHIYGETFQHDQYTGTQTNSDEIMTSSEWRPYAVDWGDAGYKDPRPEAQV